MPRRFSYLALTVIFVLLSILSWLAVKIKLSHNTNVFNTVWSGSGACRIDAYIPTYASLGMAGKIIELFSGNGFYRVYTNEGVELKSSEWLLWQREYPDMETARWVNGHAIYPTGNGYEGWTLKECN